MEAEAHRLAETIRTLTGRMPPVQEGTDGATIRLTAPSEHLPSKPSQPGRPVHRLLIEPEAVHLEGDSPEALAHAAASLTQLLLDTPEPPDTTNPTGQTPVGVSLPCLEIEDHPRFAWRGMHFDVARHFHPPETIQRYIDWLALHKLNVLHLHLTDDQGWRFASDRYPELTDVGAWRRGTVAHRLGEPPDEATHGGYLTQQQCRELVAYAAARHITIVPEIEMPGHAKAALAAYPGLACDGGPHEVWTQWGVCEDVFCLGNDRVLEMLQGVLEEVLDVFPSSVIHIGGDEVPRTRWRDCPKCQARIREHGLDDEDGLQGWFIARIARFLEDRGRRLIGWDDVLDSDLPEGAGIMNWRGSERGLEAARRGHEVVRVNQRCCYFNYRPTWTVDGPGHDQVLPLETVYQWDPLGEMPAELTDRVIGGQGCLWTEYVPTLADVEHLLLPRLGALAEGLWTDPTGKDWNRFEQALPTYLTRLRTQRNLRT